MSGLSFVFCEAFGWYWGLAFYGGDLMGEDTLIIDFLTYNLYLLRHQRIEKNNALFPTIQILKAGHPSITALNIHPHPTP